MCQQLRDTCIACVHGHEMCGGGKTSGKHTNVYLASPSSKSRRTSLQLTNPIPGYASNTTSTTTTTTTNTCSNPVLTEEACCCANIDVHILRGI